MLRLSTDVPGQRSPAAWGKEIQSMPPTSASPAPATPTAPGASAPRRPWPTRRSWLVALALFAVNYVLVSFLLPPSTTQRVAIPYTVFKQQVDASNVAAITATADHIQGRLKQAISYTAPSTGQAVQVTHSPRSSRPSQTLASRRSWSSKASSSTLLRSIRRRPGG